MSPPPAVVSIGSVRRRPGGLPVVEQERRFRPHIYWYLSFRCNLACKHCSVFSSPWVDTASDLTTQECLGVIEQMAELGVDLAILTGGEVLLRPDALTLIRALAERDVRVSLETNGLRFDNAFVDLARELQRRRRLQMTVSLDGGTAATHEALRGPGSFSHTVRGLRFLASRGVRFNIQCVLNRANYDSIAQIYELGAELHPHLATVQFAFLNPVGRGIGLARELGLTGADLVPIFERIRREKGRYPGRTLVKAPPALVPPRYLAMVFQDPQVKESVSCQFPLLGVLPNGDVSICAVSRDNPDLYFGNIREVRLREIWTRTRMDALRSRYVAAEHLAGICGDCVWQQKCKGGCRAWAYEEGGSFDAPLPLCKALAEAGEFPEVYRISKQNEVMVRKLQQAGGGGACACTGA